jgi:hypothetical protein
MAKGVLHLNVEFSAVADEEGKFARLATLLGLADADHARGKCEHLWVACTRRGESDLPQWLVEQLLGERGPEALIEAELGSWSAGRGDSKTRRINIGGAAKHCLWLSSSKDQLKREQRSKGGETRAKTSSRQLDGTFAPRPAEHPAPSSSSASELLPEDLTPARDPAVPSPVPESTNPPSLPERQALKNEIMGRLDAERQRVAAKIGVTAQPLVAFDPGERELSDRIALATTRVAFDQLRRQLFHAIAMAGAEVEIRPERMRWLTGAVFAERNFRRLAGMTSADLAADRRGPQARSGPPTPKRYASNDEEPDLTAYPRIT